MCVQSESMCMSFNSVAVLQCASSISYTAVVVATPLELSNIGFEGIKLPYIPPRKYQSTISTFVRGRLKASYFGQRTAPEGDGAV